MQRKQSDEILDFLEYSHTGAKAMGDIETQTRIARAIMAFNADVTEDIFREDVIEKQIEREVKGNAKSD